MCALDSITRRIIYHSQHLHALLHSVISGGATATLCAAAQAGLIHADTLVLPAQVHVMAQMKQVSWVGFVQVRASVCA